MLLAIARGDEREIGNLNFITAAANAMYNAIIVNLQQEHCRLSNKLCRARPGQEHLKDQVTMLRRRRWLPTLGTCRIYELTCHDHYSSC